MTCFANALYVVLSIVVLTVVDSAVCVAKKKSCF